MIYEHVRHCIPGGSDDGVAILDRRESDWQDFISFFFFVVSFFVYIQTTLLTVFIT